jgi:predicted ATPase with chaperone activity
VSLERAYQTGSLSPRGRRQVLHLARTIADLAGEDSVTAAAVEAALALRGTVAEAVPKLAC